MPEEPSKKPWPRWPRFSARALIVLVLIIGGWLGWIVRDARIQREALDAPDRAGVDADYGWEFPNCATARGDLWAPGWLVDGVGIDYFGRIKSLVFYSSPIYAALVRVGHLRRLEELFITRSRRLTLAGLADLRGLTDLRVLFRAETGVSAQDQTRLLPRGRSTRRYRTAAFPAAPSYDYRRTPNNGQPVTKSHRIEHGQWVRVQPHVSNGAHFRALCLDATIDDYPVGRRERGKCRLQVERTKGKGYRTVHTTTNKFGRWRAPKKSTYGNAATVVVREQSMTNQNIEDPKIVVASPMLHEPGLLPYRIVIRDLGNEQLVHSQVLEPGRNRSCRQGDYFRRCKILHHDTSVDAAAAVQ